MKLSLLNRILIPLGLITIVLLLLLWIVVRPKVEASLLADRLAVIQQLQKSSISNLDNTITHWSDVSRVITSQVMERPNEGEMIFRMMMTLHPEIVHMRIHSSGLSDELRSQSTAYPAFNEQILESAWVPSIIDSTLRIAWLHRKDSLTQLCALQTRFPVHRIPFVLTVVWDAKQLNNILARVPFEKDYAVTIYSTAGAVTQNTSLFTWDGTHSTSDTLSSIQNITEGTVTWRVLTSAFQSAQLWMVVAVPEKTLIKPVEEFLIYITVLIVGMMCFMSMIGLLLSYHMKRFINKMKTYLITPGKE